MQRNRLRKAADSFAEEWLAVYVGRAEAHNLRID